MKYSGGCHCGSVRYEVETDLASVMTCNCSHCHAKGVALTFVDPPQFTLLTPHAPLSEYRFNTKRIAHLFCPACGVESFARGIDKAGNEKIAINARCLQDVDLDTLAITKLNGKDF